MPLLSVPAAGAKTTIKPIFQWSTIVSANKYDLLVAKDAAFSKIVIDKTGDNALPSNAWESDIILEHDTTYYWKVKARSDQSFGAWSAISAFITESAPINPTSTITTVTMTQQTQAQLPTTQPTVTVSGNIPPWIMYGGIGLLAVIVITLVALVVITLRRRH